MKRRTAVIPKCLSSFVVVLTVAMATMLGMGSSAYAVDEPKGQNIAITPISAEINVDPGMTYQGKVTVLNQGTDDFRVRLYVEPYHVEGVDYTPKFTQLPGTTGPSEWVKLAQSTSTVLTGKTGRLDVPYTVSPPSATQPGGYYAVVFAEIEPVEAPDGGGVIPHTRVGHILYIDVKGDVKRAGELRDTSIPPVSFDGKIDASLYIKNSGGIHFKSDGVVKITDMFGKEVYKKSSSFMVLPQTERRLDANWSSTALFGVYHVTRSAALLGESKTLAEATVIVVQPVTIITAVLLFGLAFMILKHRPRHNIKSHRR